jgi:hypothetical protein
MKLTGKQIFRKNDDETLTNSCLAEIFHHSLKLSIEHNNNATTNIKEVKVS